MKLGSIALLVGIAACSLAGEGTIRVDTAKLGPKIPKSLYGIFLEEINNAGEGGLYAELIQNRGFEDAELPPACKHEGGFLIPPRTNHFWENRPVDYKLPWNSDPHPSWTLTASSNSKVDMKVVKDRPLTAASPNALCVEIQTGAATVMNGGFWGIGVEKGESYNLSFYTQTDGSYGGPIKVALLSHDGQVLASQEVAKLSKDKWGKTSLKFKATATDPKARLAFILDGKGKVWFDFVSLFPAKTFKNRPNGLRPDLAKLVADLKPAFIRFPGGCYVEGLTVETRPRWEESLGPQEGRKQTYSPWGYWNSNGFGYHEWLEFCEDVGAEALYVFNVGISCAFRSGTYLPDEELPGLIQNTLDAIEYAVGPVTSKWGAMRAKNGHPKPFPLKYVEIGNEQSGAKYGARVAMFYKAIKARYPDMKVILSSWIAGIDRAAINAAGKIDIVDEHAYTGAYWALANYDHFAKYSRSEPWELYIGEFAANAGVGRGNMQATLSDAAYMMSMEKNSDIVKMGSYAPLLENVNRRQWEVNLIHFDSSRSFGRASYYACKMFADHRPDVNLETKVNYQPSGSSAIKGPIGLGTYGTTAEFKDIKLEQSGKVVYESPLSEADAKWRARGASWRFQNGVYSQTTEDWNSWTFFGDNYEDSTLTLKARRLKGAEGFVVSVGNVEGRRVQFNVGGWGNKQHGLEAEGPVKTVPGTIESGRWYDVKVVTKGRNVMAYLDGKEIFNLTLPRVDSVLSIAGKDEKTGEIVVKVLNPSANAASMEVELAGISKVSSGSAVVLAAASNTEENSFAQPTRIAPATKPLKNPSPKFRHEFPPYSLTILRLKAAR